MRQGWIVALASVMLVMLVTAVPPASASQSSVLFLSTQLRPIEEAEKMRQSILAGYPGHVEFIPVEPVPFADRVLAETRAGRVMISLVGGVHGDFPALVNAGALQPADDVLSRLADRGFVPAYVELGKLGTPYQQYIPWMQATYIMVASREALKYLPPGANLDSLTYGQLKAWGENLLKATGRRLLGFPAGPKGLMHRFFQGYLYPSYVKSTVTHFRSQEAEAMWKEFTELWAYVNPQSTSYEFMQEPLLAGEVWVAWDHTARLINALRERPQDFVAFPAPIGPKGRGFMPVLTGLGIVKSAPNPEGAASVIEYLTRPDVQLAILREIGGFFPVIQVAMPADLPAGVKLAAEAVAKQSASPNAVPSLLPVGLGVRDGEFNRVFVDTFARIVLRREDVRRVLDQQAEKMRRIMEEAKAPCWPPDEPSTGACPVL